MNNIYFTADTHFYHDNLIKRGERSFINGDGMNETIIKNWNEIIPKNSIVYLLGDFSWRQSRRYIEGLLDRLNFGELHLIRGNHDVSRLRESWGFNSINEITNLKFKHNGKKIYLTLCHYPMNAWRYQRIGGLLLHGHSHGKNRTRTKNILDVGVDCNNFFPLSLDEVIVNINNINSILEKEHND